ncbi:hypothetical protein ACHABX_05500 [Nesterenkonia halotolerans]|uniref:hypothetical protein n=1 Tax=Nesterenkonia halotolerans TaxID=225325 RepID=UPI003EE613B1
MSWPPIHGDEPNEGDDALNQRLAHSAPPVTPATPDLHQELTRLYGATGEKAGRATQNGRFRLSRGAAFGLAACLFIAGGTTAVAVSELRSYWADRGTEPHASYEVTLPSGAECEMEMRLMSWGPPGIENTDDYSMTAEQEALAQAMYSDAQDRVDDMLSSKDFDDEIQLQKERLPDATDDVVYFEAVQMGLIKEVTDDYDRAMEEERVGGYAMGHACPGADFEGSWLEEAGDMDAYEAEQEGAGG